LQLGQQKAVLLGLDGGKEFRRAVFFKSLEEVDGMWRVGLARNDPSRVWRFVGEDFGLTLREATAEEYAAFFVKK